MAENLGRHPPQSFPLPKVVAPALVLVLLLASTGGTLASAVRPAAPGTTPAGGAPPPGVAAGALLGFHAGPLRSLKSQTPVPGTSPLYLGVSLYPKDPAALSQFATEVSTPGTAQFGHYLTPGAFAARFGPGRGTLSRVEAAFEGAGFSVVHSYPDGLFLTVRGTAQAAETFFSTRLVTGTGPNGTEMLPATLPTLPRALQPYVQAVTGLDSGTQTFSLPFSSLSGSSSPLQGGTSLITPNEVHSLYGLNSLYNVSSLPRYAQGTSIGILLWGDGFSPQDITTFEQQFYPGSEPPFTYTAVPLDGAPAPSAGAVNDPSRAPFELTLDMEWAGAAAPGSHLVVAYVPDGPAPGYSPSTTQLLDGLSYLVNSAGVSVITESFGSPDSTGTSYQSTADTLFQQAAAEGISVFAASGDDGGEGGTLSNACQGTVDTMYPASSPWVTGVGGTVPTLNGLGTLTSEVAWSHSGGGFSAAYSTPTWQQSGSAYQEIQQFGPGRRGVPDVAGPAADNLLYFDGSAQQGEGTSFASPMWAGMVAEMDSVAGHRLGFLNPRLYTLGTAQGNGFSPAPFREINQGKNCVYSAGPGPGWDPVTGWGVPTNALTLFGDLTDRFASIGMAFTPGTGQPGSSFTVALTVMNGSRPLPNIPVNVTFLSYPSPASSSIPLRTVTITTNATGRGAAAFRVPLSYLFDRILVEAQIFTRSEVGTNSSIIDVSLLGGYLNFLTPYMTYPDNVVLFVLIMAGATALGWALGVRRRSRSTPPPPTERIEQPGGSSPEDGPPPGQEAAPPPVPTGAGGWAEPTGAGIHRPPSPEEGPPGIPPVPLPVEEAPQTVPGDSSPDHGVVSSPGPTEAEAPSVDVRNPSGAIPSSSPGPTGAEEGSRGGTETPVETSSPQAPFPCWSCGRMVPGDLGLCPFCGARLA